MTENKDKITIPPQNIDAEISVLGALLLDKDAIIRVSDSLSPDDFYKDIHGLIYSAAISLFEHREPIDVITLTNKLEELKILDKIGGGSYIATLASSVPSAANIVHYAKIVSEKAILRRLIRASNEINSLALNEEQEIPVVLDKAEQAIFQVSQKHELQL